MYPPSHLLPSPLHAASGFRLPPGDPMQLRLNTDHSLAGGLIGAWPFPFTGFGDKYGNKNPVSSGSSVTLQGTEFGGVPYGDAGTAQSFVTAHADFEVATGTWAVWFREKVHNGTVRAILMGLADPGTTPGGLILYINFTDSALKATFTYDIANALNISGGTVVTGQWHHAAVTFAGASGAATLYLDGTQVATGTIPASWALPATFNLGIGYSTGPVLTTTNGLNGNFCLPHFWGRVLSAGEIATLHAEPWCMYLPPSSEGLRFGSVSPASLSQGFMLGTANAMQPDNDVRQGFALGSASAAFQAEEQYGSTSQGIRFGSRFKSDSGELNNGRYRR